MEVRRLILAGLAEHWGRLDPSLNRDLDDISATYHDAVFLVARCEARIVGTGVLVPRGDGSAEIVRMSVSKDMRREGIGSQILHRLCEQASRDNFERIVLETAETWDDAIQFYERCGFSVTHCSDGDVHFAIDLSGS